MSWGIYRTYKKKKNKEQKNLLQTPKPKGPLLEIQA